MKELRTIQKNLMSWKPPKISLYQRNTKSTKEGGNNFKKIWKVERWPPAVDYKILNLPLNQKGSLQSPAH